MLRSRLIPCLLIHNKGLVKTVRFADPKYVGDPLNAVRIFNEKEVDELVVLDIDATRLGVPPDNKLIRSLAAECRMPLCYGGGVKSVRQAAEIIKMGVEKVALSSAAVETPKLVADIGRFVGTQSVVAVLDVRSGPRGYEIWTHNATRNTGRVPIDVARQLEDLGVGEITLNAIDRDGVMQGYDIDLVRQVRSAIAVPITVLGGAGSLGHIQRLFQEFGIIGASAGSLFVFKGTYKAVLINYPSRAQKLELTRIGPPVAIGP
jgi:cyclase